MTSMMKTTQPEGLTQNTIGVLRRTGFDKRIKIAFGE